MLDYSHFILLFKKQFLEDGVDVREGVKEATLYAVFPEYCQFFKAGVTTTVGEKVADELYARYRTYYPDQIHILG